MKGIFLCQSPENIDRVYGPRQRETLRERIRLDEKVYSLEEARACPSVRNAEVIFSTWGMPRVEADAIRSLFPSLKAVFYAAGTVQAFAEPFLDCDVRLFSAWMANGVPVAEFTVSQIELAAKGTFRLQRLMLENRAAAAEAASHYPGLYDVQIGLLGLGAVGARVAEMLKNYDCRVLAYDPFDSDEKLAELGVQRAGMEEIFAQCEIVSNHLANLPATQHIIRREHLLSMRDYSTFINTGRGAQLDESELYELLTTKPTVTALLDVLTDEEHSDESPLRALPNCFFTPHIAGSMGREVRRMAAYMADECGRWLRGEALRYEVTREMLRTMA